MTTRRFVYPASVEKDDAGFWLVTFPDIPEAGTDSWDHEEAIAEAADALVAALGGYVDQGRAIPQPSRRQRGQVLVALGPLVSAKLALVETMREAGVTRVALAGRLGVSEAAVRRLLDLDHRSHIGHVDAALRTLGKSLVLEVRDAA